MLRVKTAKESENREKFPDPRTSTDNNITSTQALSRLAAMLNFTAIQGNQWKIVCELFDSLQIVHTAIADVTGTLGTLGRTLDPNQFQFLLKHSVCPLVQLQVPAHLCHPVSLSLQKNISLMMNYMKKVELTQYYPDPITQIWTKCQQNTPQEHWPAPFTTISENACSPSSLHLRQILQTSSRLRERNSSQILQGENTKQAKSRPKQRKLKWQEHQTKKNYTWTGRTPTNCSYRSRSQNATTRGHQTKEEIQV